MQDDLMAFLNAKEDEEKLMQSNRQPSEVKPLPPKPRMPSDLMSGPPKAPPARDRKFKEGSDDNESSDDAAPSMSYKPGATKFNPSSMPSGAKKGPLPPPPGGAPRTQSKIKAFDDSDDDEFKPA
jgi:hypothetical protein